ncbi:T6SS effector BTH_I2691 family protein [Achromobacter arsenitoxydans]|uniref:Toxin VasX N-terminal region domain-containing protein n=1 Tax=Achromobacter arsenitoxydans SY8 TaxID=477184 RepID=H0F5B6_9BURK|nr:T6SS effector BTH_I2691 family protein [Achromobacter arsenitoxydans]EHK66430.1 hypothetical protein KYC_09796 [Achromobacter arsenitoxydans SY8]
MAKASAGSATSTPACSPRVPILPIRYAVVPNAGGAPLYRYAESGFKLEQGLPRIELSSYTLRALRPGYVYVFMKGSKGEKFVIHEYDGEGHYKELTYLGLEQYHRRDRYRTVSSRGWVWADTSPDTASEVWIGFSPHLWTNAVTARMAADPSARKRHMRQIDMAELTSGEKTPSSQPHVLPASALSHWVEDFKPRDQRMDLDWSSHSSKDDLPISTFLAQGQHYRYTQPRVPVVVVLNDAEGLSLDLGLSVAAYQHQLRDILPSQQHEAIAKQGKAEFAVPACFSQDVEKLSVQSQRYHHKNLVAILLEQTLQSMYPADQTPPDTLARLRDEYQRKQVGGRRRATLSELRYQVLTDSRISPMGRRLAERIDTAKYHAFLAERDQREAHLRSCLDTALKACRDHDRWLATAESEHRDVPTSLAAALAAYDRDERLSAGGLEVSLALMIHPMSQALPGTEDDDARFQRLSAWLDRQDSPLYMALAPFNPFKEKADSVGTLLGAADNAIEGLAGRFPAMTGITDLTAEAVTTVVLTRLPGKTRWTASDSLRQRVLAAVQEANGEKALGLIGARYRVTDQAVLNDAYSKEVNNFLQSGMAEVTENKRVRITGTRTVTVEQALTRRVRPNVSALLTTAGGGGLNVGMLWFNVISLKSAYASLEKDADVAASAAFASAIFGVAGATAAVLVSARATQKVLVLRYAAAAPGMEFGNGFMRFIAGNLFARLAGYPAILAGLASDGASFFRKRQHGDGVAADYTVGGGVLVGLGSAVVLEGALAIAGPTVVIPYAGWAAAAIVLVGAGILAGGVWLHSLAAARVHSPLELWAARGIFGTRKNDGEIRTGIALDADKMLPPFDDVAEEIKAWYAAYYAPQLLEKHEAEVLGVKDVDSRWQSASSWSITRSATPSVVEFTVLCRGYLIGQSAWSEILEQDKVCVPATPACYDTAAGLVLHYRKEITDAHQMILTVNYSPNQGMDESAVATVQFKLEG